MKEVATLTTNLITDFTPPHIPVSNIAPFTYKDGETYLSELSRLRTFINANLVGEVNNALNAVITEVTTAITTEQTEATTAITNLTNYVNETVSALTASVLEDTTIATQIDTSGSLTREALDALYALTDAKLAAAVITGTTQTALNAAYAPHSTVSATDSVIAAIVVAGTTKTALDAAYAPHSTVSMTDAGIEAIVANVASATRLYLNSIYAPVGTVGATDSAVDAIVSNVSSATHAYLVATFAPASNVSMTDAGLEAIIANAVSASRIELNSLYAPASVVGMTDSGIETIIANAVSATRVELDTLYKLTDAAIDAYITTSGSATRGTLDALYGGSAVAQAFVSVKAYGAVGDGTTDDTTAIQNAVNSIANGVVFFPTGNYVVSAQINIPSGIRLSGDNNSESNIVSKAATIVVFNVNSNVTIEHLGFTSSVAPTANAFMSIQGSNVNIRRCRFNQFYAAINIGTVGGSVVNAISIESCTFIGNNGSLTYANGFGVNANANVITIANYTNVIITNCFFSGSTGQAVMIYNGTTLIISKCTFNSGGITFAVATALTTNETSILDCSFNTSPFLNNTNAFIFFANVGNIYTTKINNCSFANGYSGGGTVIYTGINTGNVDGLIIKGNTMRINASNFGGIIIDGPTFNVIIQGNEIGGGNTGIQLGAAIAVSRIVVADNIIGSIGGGSGNVLGIKCGAFANTRYNLVNNILNGNTTALTDSSTGTPIRTSTGNLTT